MLCWSNNSSYQQLNPELINPNTLNHKQPHLQIKFTLAFQGHVLQIHVFWILIKHSLFLMFASCNGKELMTFFLFGRCSMSYKWCLFLHTKHLFIIGHAQKPKQSKCNKYFLCVWNLIDKFPLDLEKMALVSRKTGLFLNPSNNIFNLNLRRYI